MAQNDFLNGVGGKFPKYDLVGPTVDDDIRRAIWRYGPQAVAKAVKEATKARRGRKLAPDWPELQAIFEQDARAWLAGTDPFESRSNYSIAREFSEREPGHSAVSTHKRIERKLSRGPHDRRFWMLHFAEIQSRLNGPYERHLQALEALSQLPQHKLTAYAILNLEDARGTLADYVAREGGQPPPAMTFVELAEAAKLGPLKEAIAGRSTRGLLGKAGRQ